MDSPKTNQLVVISGRSGAGKSVALRVLEDLGYYCVDNLPVNLLTPFSDSMKNQLGRVAVSIDIRNLPNDPNQVTTQLNALKQAWDVMVIFVDAQLETLLKRYSETRRIHPLSIGEEKLALAQAIESEEDLLEPIKAQADLVIDSSQSTLYDLSETVRLRVLGRESKELVMVFESFGFKYGVPKDADYVFDVRFLPNPHWEPELRSQTGLDKPVQEYLAGHQEVQDLTQDIQSFVEKWLPQLEKNNRSYLTIAIGCTGGKHRSVYVAQQLAMYFADHKHQVQVRHTTLERPENKL
ncbi:glmZ(sRNA)-inactivating NTPase [Vibrio sp. qd031]|uniref:RNase adapter RapZ n=1 Tax=Vibrio sp. qd031 TaxID=1603038 RepID=UPI000A111798|nr:RNase adapter RapZ [Vibrio sp. qd031]ORT52036.1 glmZ(sRNA)-inactivating NTPase [Vibrio sp. qd031]